MATTTGERPLTFAARNDSISSQSSSLPDPATAPSITATPSAAIEALRDITYGSLAGICGKFIEYPFDTVKVRLQSHVPTTTSPPYRGPLDCFIRSYRYDGGMRSLYRGISAPLVGAAVETSSLFFSYRIAQEALIWSFPSLNNRTKVSEKVKLPLPALVACGAASGAFTSLLLTPIELVKCRMQVPALASSPGYRPRTPITIITQIFKSEGLLGFWHGQLGTLIRETGGSAAWFGTYEGVCNAFKHYGNKRTSHKATENAQLSVWQHMLAGATAGMAYNFIFYPADTVKSRMQTEDFSTGAKTAPPTVKSISENSSTGQLQKARESFGSTARILWREHGVRGFYRGCGITVARAAPSSAFIFAIYEALRAQFG